jgi:hypothetical protein
MRTISFIIMLAVIGAVMAWELRGLMTESIWYVMPAFAVLVFAGILHVLLQRPSASSRRRALLFGVAVVALLATGLFAAFGYSFIRLVRGGAPSFDPVWICSAAVTGALASWLWLRFVRLLRQT